MQALPLLQNTLQRIFSLVVALQKENEWSRATVYYLSIFARVLVHNRPFFFAFFQQLSAQAGQNLLAPLVDFWAEKVAHAHTHTRTHAHTHTRTHAHTHTRTHAHTHTRTHAHASPHAHT
jgi:hypothetical protein